MNGAVRTEQRVLTPKVLQTARSHYNCPQTAHQLAVGGSPFSCEGDAHERCMDGVPIENNGGDGTAASHWEKREEDGAFQLWILLPACMFSAYVMFLQCDLPLLTAASRPSQGCSTAR